MEQAFILSQFFHLKLQSQANKTLGKIKAALAKYPVL